MSGTPAPAAAPALAAAETAPPPAEAARQEQIEVTAEFTRGRRRRFVLAKTFSRASPFERVAQLELVRAALEALTAAELEALTGLRLRAEKDRAPAWLRRADAIEFAFDASGGGSPGAECLAEFWRGYLHACIDSRSSSGGRLL